MFVCVCMAGQDAGGNCVWYIVYEYDMFKLISYLDLYIVSYREIQIEH